MQADGVIGVSRPRHDSEEKLLGAARFAADSRQGGLLHARLVLAQEAHARIRRIERDEAERMPGVVAVLVAADLPIANQGMSRSSEPLARDEIVFAGQPVAIVVAETEAAAEDAAELVSVECEPLPAALGLDAALALDAPPARLARETGDSDVGSAHAAVGDGDGEEQAEELSANVAFHRRYHLEDAAAALAASDIVVRGRFDTQWLHQAYLETQVATVTPDGRGGLLVEASTQGAFHTRSDLAALFDIPVERIRVVPAEIGGSFGAKLMIVEPLAAAAAIRLDRPVRLALTRSEDFLATNPAPGGSIELAIGASDEGRLTALEARIAFERGAFHGWGVETVAAVLIGGVYRWQAFDVHAYGVETNRVGFGAYRAPGAPPAAFALESLLDELAAQLGADPIELRLRNLAAEGDPRPDGKPWRRLGSRECLERLQESPLWQRRSALPEGEALGVAIGVWPGASDSAGAACRLDDDGGITLVTGFSDMSGAASGFAAIAAEVLGVAPGKIRVVTADTASAPRAPLSGGSKATLAVGRAVEAAAQDARTQILELAAAELEADPADLEIADGTIRPKGAPTKAVELKALGTRVGSGRCAPVEGVGRTASVPPSPSVAAHLVHVRVDAETGRVELLHWTVAQDVGRALNPALCEGQMQGGVAQAIGWALHEELVADEGGQVVNGSLAGYGIPGTSEIPGIETLLVEVPTEDGPFGAKGIGEAPVVGGPAAVANAIAAASGIRLRRLPMTPERVWAAVAAGPATTP